jgi:GAG-pre-integrase domain
LLLDNDKLERMFFDSDSFLIALDNCASRCMMNDESDFIDTPIIVHADVLGIGKVSAAKMGTLKWSIEDDEGKVHDFLLPESYFIPDLPIRLLSPQHWAQINWDQHAHSDTNADRITLEWDSAIKTVPLNAANVGIIRSAPGFQKAKPVLKALNALLPTEPCCFPAHLIPPDDDETEEQSSDASRHQGQHTHFPNVTTVSEGDEFNEQSTETTPDATTEFSIDNIPLIEDDELDQQDSIYSKDHSAQLLHWHYRLGHLPFKTIQVMAEQKLLPPALARCKVPQCAACLYGKATKRAWRTRAPPNKVTPTSVTGPGDCVSVDCSATRLLDSKAL